MWINIKDHFIDINAIFDVDFGYDKGRNVYLVWIYFKKEYLPGENTFHDYICINFDDVDDYLNHFNSMKDNMYKYNQNIKV
jgi:hypothetical protein